jgi:purine nucleosidase
MSRSPVRGHLGPRETDNGPMDKRPLIIDCDPGQDDAIALLLALGRPDRFTVLGITTVAGNVPVAKTSRNARIVCDWAGRSEVPVHAGCEGPLLGQAVHAEHIHGTEGLDGPALHAPRTPLQPRHAADFLVKTLRTHATRVTVCALGPLTNIALALRLAPDLADRIQELIWMGGAHSEGGNVTPAAEFNAFADPEAAEIVMQSGVALTVVPLDVTHQVLADAPWRDDLLQCGGAQGRLAAQIVGSHGLPERSRFSGAVPMHDPCVMLYLLAPALFDGRRVNVVVECAGPRSRGQTVVDWHGVSGRPANALFLRSVDAAAALALLGQQLAVLP